MYNTGPSLSVCLSVCLLTHSELSFIIHWAYDSSDDCNEMDFFSEGIELAVRRPGDWVWTPLAFYTTTSEPREPTAIDLLYSDDADVVRIRGYNVTVTEDDRDIQHSIMLRLCHESVLSSETGVQFRWLQTMQHISDTSIRDIWSLDNVNVSVVYNESCRVQAFYDDFEAGDIVK